MTNKLQVYNDYGEVGDIASIVKSMCRKGNTERISIEDVIVKLSTVSGDDLLKSFRRKQCSAESGTGRYYVCSKKGCKL